MANGPSDLTDQVGESADQESDYSSHKQQILAAQPTPGRIDQLEQALIEAYAPVIEYRQVPYVRFEDFNAEELARAFVAFPIIIKPTLTCVNVAQRAIKRDLGFDFNTYGTSVDIERASLIAGYVKPLLPPAIAIPALMELDRFFWTDKEMRSAKGAWEKTVTTEMSERSNRYFIKRKFDCDGQDFEIDAAYPSEGDIEIAVDIKRLESPRDIHKRGDEIVNKAAKFKKAFPHGKFAAVIYYPFPAQHVNMQNRLRSHDIDGVYFAANTASSISSAVELLVAQFGLRKD